LDIGYRVSLRLAPYTKAVFPYFLKKTVQKRVERKKQKKEMEGF
jgi:hypothetical protein